MKKNYNLILFDFDGVIGDSFDFVVDILYSNVQKYTKLKLSREDIVRDLQNISIFKILKEYHIPKLIVPLIVFKIKKDLSKRMMKTNLFDDFEDVLNIISKTNLDVGLLTSNSRKNIDLFMGKYGLISNFNFIVCGSSFLDKSKSISKTLKKYGFDSKDVLYVGDEVRDIVACNKLGIDILSVSYGFNSKSLLEEYNYTYLVDSISELIDFFENF